ncbi:hypothetical protein Btru_013391 [Bulinus truncatus]|nr:hypothetical protein Btru_013391 [Bulinus truncatus]
MDRPAHRLPDTGQPKDTRLARAPSPAPGPMHEPPAAHRGPSRSGSNGSGSERPSSRPGSSDTPSRDSPLHHHQQQQQLHHHHHQQHLLSSSSATSSGSSGLQSPSSLSGMKDRRGSRLSSGSSSSLSDQRPTDLVVSGNRRAVADQAEVASWDRAAAQAYTGGRPMVASPHQAPSSSSSSRLLSPKEEPYGSDRQMDAPHASRMAEEAVSAMGRRGHRDSVGDHIRNDSSSDPLDCRADDGTAGQQRLTWQIIKETGQSSLWVPGENVEKLIPTHLQSPSPRPLSVIVPGEPVSHSERTHPQSEYGTYTTLEQAQWKSDVDYQDDDGGGGARRDSADSAGSGNLPSTLVGSSGAASPEPVAHSSYEIDVLERTSAHSSYIDPLAELSAHRFITMMFLKEPVPTVRTMMFLKEPVPTVRTMMFLKEPVPTVRTMMFLKEPVPTVRTMMFLKEPVPTVRTMMFLKEPVPTVHYR